MNDSATKGAHTAHDARRVLVATCDSGTSAVLRKHLQTLGFAIAASTTDAAEAVRHCESSPPDLAVIDVGLEEPRGDAVARVTSVDLGIPVVALSPTGCAEDLEIAVDAGVIGMLVSPLSARQLAATVAVGLNGRAARVELAQKVRDLEQRLKDRRIVEQAKWLLVEQLGMTEDAAHRRLSRMARDLRRCLPDVARSLVESHPSEIPPTPAAAAVTDRSSRPMSPRLARRGRRAAGGRSPAS